ncbi:MAG TPA: TIGR03032 family protein, partial [Gemmataceae bacterium]|nr:TIGR03032 family protein [Gemmataceae bacterium]
EALLKAKGKAPVLAYTSSPSRGLDILLELFPQVRQRFPDLRALIFSGLNIYQVDPAADPYAPMYERCRATAGVEYIGNLPQPVLAERLKACTILAYPGTTPEMSSIAVLEAMAAGLEIVTTRLGALPETAGIGQPRLVEPLRGPDDRGGFAKRFADALGESATAWSKDPASCGAARFKTIAALQKEATWTARANEWEAAIESWKREKQKTGGTANVPASSQSPQIKPSPPAWYGAQASPPAGNKTSNEPWLEVTTSRYFADWLAEQRTSLGFTTYQSGKLFLLGRNAQGTISIHERTLSRVMGMWGSEQTLWMSTLFQLWRFENALRPGETYQGYDRLYIPKVGYTTGDIDIHDIAIESSGRVVFVNTKFGCLATLNERYSFTPLWKPPFLSKLAPEDRCHLNGLALENGKARYVTAVSASDVNDAWRDRRRDGGIVMSVPDGAIVARGLSMPHSPRMHKGELWVLNSGLGHLGKIDLKTGKFESVTFCPGYLRGLAFVGNYAVVGLSQPRHEKTFSGLPLDEELSRRNADSRCGLQVIDLRSGDIVHWLRLEGVVRELYDVVALPGVARPMALGFHTTEIQQILSMGDEEAL